ncbi:MAG: Hsp70 family protein [Actinophytocola sp.]|uniref:Hsp70 family protein n=1 Tax=Actinophytocola sp. TaxID=1872138 RepID=UPI003C794A71
MTLVIDFGTVNTVAMLDGRLVTVDGAPWLPSVVHEGLVGADAAELANGLAARDLKERLDPDEVAALFARVLSAARDQGGVVGAVLVTHPAGWPRERVDVLVSAAGAWARPVPEPVAVAAGHGVGAGETVLVVDAGGGTWDVTAVRGHGGEYVVVTAASLSFGGNDVDRIVVERVRPSLRSVATDGALLESARAAKEQLSRHESTEIVLPDHRAVRLDRAEFERLVSPGVDRLAVLVAEVGVPTGATRVLLVGGSSRMPLLARRIGEVTGLPVTTDPEPETAVVRGARLLARPSALEDPLAPPPADAEPARPVPPPASAVPPTAAATQASEEPVRPPVRTAAVPRRGTLAVVVLLLIVAAVAVVFGGEQATSGHPVAIDLPPPLPEAPIPPAVAGDEVVNADNATYTSGSLGKAAEYRHPSGNTVAVTVTGVETVVTAPQPYLVAPDGYRWLVIRLHVANTEGPDFPQDPMELVAVLDDRGQWLRQPYGYGQIACTEGVPPVIRIPAGAEVDACGVVSVPDATPVTAVLFGERSPEAQAPLRFPVDVPAVRDRAAPTRVVGTLGGPAETVDGLRVRVDLVLDPSGYLGSQVPAPGHRFVVVRAAVTATGQRQVTVLLRDDRGAFLSSMVTAATGCPPLPSVLGPEDPVYGCEVFEIAAETPVTGVTLQGRGPDVTRWPTWRLS